MEIIIRNPIYNDCIIEKKADINDFKHSIECQIVESGSNVGYKRTVTEIVYCCGETYEDCLEAFFIKNRRWSYCNDINITFANEIDKKKYSEYFFKDNDGISRYAKCGGKMD